MPDQNVIFAVQQQCQLQGVSSSLAKAVLNNESYGGVQFNPDGTTLTSSAGALGAMQVEPSTAAGLPPPYNSASLDSIDGNAAAGVAVLSQLQKEYPNDPARQLAAYDAGPGAVNKATNLYGDDWLSHLPAETQKYVQKGLPTATGNAAPAVPSSSDATGNTGLPPLQFSREATQVQSVVLEQPTVDFDVLFPDVINPDGLDEVPWYSDRSLVTGNPKVRGSVTPVVFEIALKGRDVELLSDSSGAPIQVQLNASMKNFNVAMKHVFTPQRTRTGWHITMWGMQADVITGNCTTGVFMNQFGLTDFFSTAVADDQVTQLVTSGFKAFQSGAGSFPDLADQRASGVVEERLIQDDTTFYNQQIGLIAGTPDPSEAFRVAAQDAFMEFLLMFKNNGIYWLNNQGGMWGKKEQVGVDEWSPEVALSATAKNARNNDVATRGTVMMKFRGSTYSGYFKSLTWQMDAQNPFKFDFNFVFQVERTLGYMFSPAW
jgi:hypothetical protein